MAINLDKMNTHQTEQSMKRITSFIRIDFDTTQFLPNYCENIHRRLHQFVFCGVTATTEGHVLLIGYKKHVVVDCIKIGTHETEERTLP